MSEFGALIQEILNLDGCPVTKRRVLDRIFARAGSTLYVPTTSKDREHRRKVVRAIVSTYNRAEAVRVIAIRFGVSKRTARRWTNDVIER